MSLYAIDFHLSFTVNKPMDVFDKRVPDYNYDCEVLLRQFGYISFRFASEWYAGGVGESREYGLTYRLKDGKKLAVQDVASGKKVM